MNRLKRLQVAGLVVALAVLPGAGISVAADQLDAPASIVFDQYRVPTIVAETEHDAIFLQGYMHARDRFFQMDVQRRAFAGKLGGLVGSGALPQDVQLRTLGLDRAAVRSLAVQTPEILDWLDAYSAGVNAWLNDTSNPLPIEYGFLETDRGGIPQWEPLDSMLMVKGLAFGLSFDLSDIDRTLALLTFLPVCGALGCNGLQLLNDDLYRTAPFEAVPSIPPSSPPPLPPGQDPPSQDPPADEEMPTYMTDPNFESLTQAYRDAIVDIPMLERALENDQSAQGSNWWVVSGALTESGFPMIANDPHLALDAPSTFYQVHLSVNGGINVTGSSFPGAPGIVLGCNDTICWGGTVNAVDVTDVYQEVLLTLDPTNPAQPTHTFWNGAPEPIQFIPQQFDVNIIGNGVPNTVFDAGVPADQGGVTLVVPRRNNGSIVQILFDPTSPTPLTALTVQYTGWSATQELETFRRFARASSMTEFKDALQYFDVGSQNWSYADINGNIAYYTSAEVPLREDLQNFFFPAGLQPPSLIRDGTNTNKHEWLALSGPKPPQQAVDFQVLPFAEMPQIENPAAGYIINANNDPIGTTFDNLSWNQFRAGFNGVLYLSSGYATGYRQGRLQQLMDQTFAGGGKMSVLESITIQADNALLDAQVLTPYLFDSYANATTSGAAAPLAGIAADPRVAEAISRLQQWNFTTPTGIDVGFDPFDNPLAPGPPSQAEIDESVAATIYAAWRGQVVQRVLDTTLASLPVPLDDLSPPSAQAMAGLRRLLENFQLTGGTGASLINFFTVPGISDPATARDIILLGTLQDALNLLASDEFTPAFGNSTDLEDYRWGKLHRIVFDSVLGGPLSIPPTGSPLNVGPGLPGLARAGGMGAVDASAHSARADGLNEFMFGSGPARRLIATMEPDGPDVLEVIPGGESGNPLSPFATDQLFLWLVNANKPLPVSLADVNDLAVETETFFCGNGVAGPGEECDDGNSNNSDGCNTDCEFVPVITCLNPLIDVDPDTCEVDPPCSAVATCVDPATGAALTPDCEAGPFGAGLEKVEVTCSDGEHISDASCEVTGVDSTPPTISVTLDPTDLWPPNHRMIDITAAVAVTDSCGGASAVLDSVTSNEPDNGVGDGNTVNDVQGADVGTADFMFEVRAERQGGGSGRFYTVTYTAVDSSGNTASDVAFVTVDHDRSGMTDPISITLESTASGTRVNWTGEPQAVTYNVIRADFADLAESAVAYEFTSVVCIEGDSVDTSTSGNEDPALPAPGQLFVYMAEFNESTSASSYGTESAAKPRVPLSGDCP